MTQYRELNADEKVTLFVLREFESACADACALVKANPGHDPRSLAVARTQLEGACMWLTKALTNPTNAFKE